MDSLIDNLSGDVTSLKQTLDDYRDETCFVVPLDEEINIGAVARRAAGLTDIGVIADVNSPTIDLVEQQGAFWSQGSTGVPVAFEKLSQTVRAMFNIAHPFDYGPFLDGNNNTRYEMSPSGGKETTAEGPNYSIFYTIELSDETTVDNVVRSIWSLLEELPSGKGMKVSSHVKGANPKYEVASGEEYRVDGKTLYFNSGALSPGSLLLGVAKAADCSKVNKVLQRCYRRGLNIAAEFPADSMHYFLLKLHPVHSDIEERFYQAARERRKLAQVEWARDEVPGYKKISTFESAPRERTLTRVDGRAFIVKRRSGEGGRAKDADDFMWAIDSEEPDLLSVFQDTQRALRCPTSGEAFLDAIYRIWNAEWAVPELEDAIAELAAEMPPNSNASAMEYSRETLLWIYAMQFIVEDINYRFNFHPVTYRQNSIKYRKQGRDQPMNIVLTIAAQNPSAAELEALTEASKSSGGVVSLPEYTDGFEHLNDWLKAKNVIRTYGGRNRSSSDDTEQSTLDQLD